MPTRIGRVWTRTWANVAVLDIDEAIRMKRALLDSHTVIVVATMQAFRRRAMSALNVYKNNGELMSHFENLPAELLDVVEREPEGHFNQSLVNVFRIRRPFVIIDEAHNARQPLSFETLRRLNPSAVLELTATPNLKAQTVKEDGETFENPPSNVLHSVSAYALKAEEMIKLPIYLRYREPWDELLGDAIGLLKHLEGEARQEEALTGEHIRPIMLLQAQPEYKDKASITVDVVEAKLREFGIAPEENLCSHGRPARVGWDQRADAGEQGALHHHGAGTEGGLGLPVGLCPVFRGGDTKRSARLMVTKSCNVLASSRTILVSNAGCAICRASQS